jgi:hypothetical protein
VNTGNSYLRSGHHTGHLGFRNCGSIADAWAVGQTGWNDATESTKSAGSAPSPKAARVVRPLPMRTLDPSVLDDCDGDDHASPPLVATSLDAVVELAIAMAELRCGREVVRDVLVALTAGNGRTSAELSAGDDERAVSIAHVLAVLGNHLHRTGNRFRLPPLLRAAVHRRYPLGARAARDNASVDAGQRDVLRMVLNDTARVLATWREVV